MKRKDIHIITRMGGKFYGRKWIVDKFPLHHTYVEPFGGAAYILLCKSPSKLEVYNDIDGDLVNLFEQARTHKDELIEYLESFPYSRKIHDTWLKEWKLGIKGNNNIERAARFFYLSNSSVKGRFGTFLTGATRNRATSFNNKINNIRDFAARMKKVVIENLDFEKCIKIYDSKNTFFYIDPPYYDTDYYSVRFSHDDHVRLYKILKDIKGKFMLSYYPHPVIMEMYKNFNIYERIVLKDNQLRSQMKNRTTEILITNFTTQKTLDPNNK